MVSLKGRLLVAAPSLTDPNFDRSVVLILEHSPEGAVGVVLNRPTSVDVSDVFADWSSSASTPAVVFSGGPVQLDRLTVLARITDLTSATADGTPRVLRELSMIDPRFDPNEVDGVIDARFFRGYSGWSGGQLDGEVNLGAWIVVDSEPLDAFSPDPGRLWRRILGRQPGTLAWMANYPDDESVN